MSCQNAQVALSELLVRPNRSCGALDSLAVRLLYVLHMCICSIYRACRMRGVLTQVARLQPQTCPRCASRIATLNYPNKLASITLHSDGDIQSGPKRMQQLWL